VSPFVERLFSRLPARDVRPAADGRKRAAVAALIHDDPTNPRVLLMKRVEREGDPWSGHISLPGGGFQATDGDLLATSIRETEEELGIDLRQTRLIGPLPALSPLSAGPMGIEVTPFAFVTEVAPPTHVGPEALSAFWLPLGLASAGTYDGEFTYPGTDRKFPAWNYEGFTIWGMTWRIVADLIALGAAPK
jgi:8-oxo-dGTP pyrophosphatase MutT (NUDIX family)